MSQVNRRQAMGAVIGVSVMAGVVAAGAAPASDREGPVKSALPAPESAPRATLALPATEFAPRATVSPCGMDWTFMKWARGPMGERVPDLGDGTYLNPVVPGDHPDPSVIRVGNDYYMTFSSFDAYPGLMIWHSKDLVNWVPVGPALQKPIGSVWAPDLCVHNGRFYIYIPTRNPNTIWVIHAEKITGPWSDPVDLGLHHHIDPDHVVDTDGRRYLALSAGDIVPLSADGLRVTGKPRHIYDPWHYPEDWVVESFSPEGPKIFRHGDYFYMLTAVGGTAGPPTGHMVIAARAKSLFGPWENAPNNPLVHTISAREKWWSRGHASAVEAPDGSWWMLYHGYENGFWTLGRQCLLSPMHWRNDGWIVADGGDLSKPIPKPVQTQNRSAVASATQAVASATPATQAAGSARWAFYKPGPEEKKRLKPDADGLTLQAKGTQPFDCSPLCMVAGDLNYSIEAEITRIGEAQAGLLLFYNKKLYCGLGFDGERLWQHRAGLEKTAALPSGGARHLFIRITNQANIVTIHTSTDGEKWLKYGVQMEVSGYNHNTGYDFLALKPALYVARSGAAYFRGIRYRGLG